MRGLGPVGGRVDSEPPLQNWRVRPVHVLAATATGRYVCAFFCHRFPVSRLCPLVLFLFFRARFIPLYFPLLV